MANPGIGEFLGRASRWIDNTINFFNKKGKRDAVQGMEKDVADDNNSGVNKRMSELARKAKNKQDSV